MSGLQRIRCWVAGHHMRRGTITRVDQGTVDVVFICVRCGDVEDAA